MVGYLDPFNERANDSFFDQLPKQYGVTKDAMKYESFYGSPNPSDKNSKKKLKGSSTPKRYSSLKETSAARSSRRDDHMVDYNTPSKNVSGRSNGTAETERSSSPETPPENNQVGYDRSTLNRTELSGWKSRDVFGGSSHGAASRKSQKTASSSRHSRATFAERKKYGRDIFAKQNKHSKMSEGMEYEVELQDPYALPPAFQVTSNGSPKKSMSLPSPRKGGRGAVPTHDAEEAMKRVSERNGSKERRSKAASDSVSRHRERSLSVGRMREKKEEKRIERRDRGRNEDEALANSSSAGYQALHRERSKDRRSRKHDSSEDSAEGNPLKSSSTHRTRSSSVGKMSNRARQIRDENADLSSSRHRAGSSEKKSRDRKSRQVALMDNDGNNQSLSASQHNIRCRRRRDKESSGEEKKPRRSSSVGRLFERKENVRDQRNEATEDEQKSRKGKDRREERLGLNTEQPKRSSSLGPLNKRRLESGNREGRSEARSERPSRSNSLGPLQKKKDEPSRREGRSEARAERPTRTSSLGPLQKKRENPGRSEGRSNVRAERSGRSNSVGPLRKKREEAEIKEEHQDRGQALENPKSAVKTMDDIFGSAETVRQAKREKQASSQAINAVHGNRSALAAWKMRESFKNSPRKRPTPKSSISSAAEIAATIEDSPHGVRNAGQYNGVPSLFLSPKSCRKDKPSPYESQNSNSRRAMRSIDESMASKRSQRISPSERNFVRDRTSRYDR